MHESDVTTFETIKRRVEARIDEVSTNMKAVSLKAGRRDAQAETALPPASTPTFDGRPYAPVGSTFPSPVTAIMRSVVVDYVKQGRCDDAVSAALSLNDLDLADKAKRVCTPAAQIPAQ